MTIQSIGNQTIQFDPNQSQTNQTVMEVQQALNQLARANILPENGIFNRSMEDAIREFQQTHDLPDTGTIDGRTINALNNNLASQTVRDSQRTAPVTLNENQRAQRRQELRTEETLTRARIGEPSSPDEPFYSQIAEQRTAESILPNQRGAFDQIEAANNRTESGGQFRRSVLGTVAGAPASLGRGQILVAGQVHEMMTQLPRTAEGRSALQRAGVTQQALQNIDSHGRAAMAWHDLVATDGHDDARGRIDRNILQATGLTQDEAQQIRNSSRQGRFQDVLNNPDFVSRFESRTGLPADDLRIINSSRPLLNRTYVNEFNQTTRELRGIYTQEFSRNTAEIRQALHDFRAEHRGERNALQNIQEPSLRQAIENNPRLLRNHDQQLIQEAALLRTINHHPELNHLRSSSGLQLNDLIRQGAASRVIQNHPDLQELVNAHPDTPTNRMGVNDIALYLERPRRMGEIRNGWYTSGARQTGEDWNTFNRALPNLDLITNRNRSISNYQSARDVIFPRDGRPPMEGFSRLSQTEQTRILGQIARVHHYNLNIFNAIFGPDHAPRSVDQFNTWLRELHQTNPDLWTSVNAWTNNYNRLFVQNPQTPNG